MKLSVLELGYLLPGMRPQQVLRDVVASAPLLERLGFHRLWFAEHHASQYAFASPEPLVAHAAATTTRLRVGPAGVLMNVHTPVRVAEVFRALAVLHPGRLDLGVAGGGLLRDYALAYQADPEESLRSGLYGRRVEQLVWHLRGEPERGPLGGPDVVPRGTDGPTVVTLGAGKGRGNAMIAAKLGLPFCYSLFHAGGTHAREVIDAYRDAFQPSAWLRAPYALVAGNMLCAATNNAAAAMLHRARTWEPAFNPALLGRPERCRQQIEDLVARHGADEFVIATAYDEMSERFDAYHLLAEACALTTA